MTDATDDIPIPQKETLTDSDLLAFGALSKLISDVVSSQSDENIELTLYKHLVDKTGPTSVFAIRKHLNACSLWLTENEDAWQTQDHTKIGESSFIRYSDKVYLPMRLIFDNASVEDHKILWMHLLALQIRINPQSNAKSVLMKLMNERNGSQGASPATQNFMADMMGDIQTELQSQGINEQASPFEAIEKMAANGALSRLMGSFASKVKDGGINPMEMMSSIQGMASQNGAQMPDMGAMMNMAQTMAPMMGAAASGLNIPSTVEESGSDEPDLPDSLFN